MCPSTRTIPAPKGTGTGIVRNARITILGGPRPTAWDLALNVFAGGRHQPQSKAHCSFVTYESFESGGRRCCRRSLVWCAAFRHSLRPAGRPAMALLGIAGLRSIVAATGLWDAPPPCCRSVQTRRVDDQRRLHPLLARKATTIRRWIGRAAPRRDGIGRAEGQGREGKELDVSPRRGTTPGILGDQGPCASSRSRPRRQPAGSIKFTNTYGSRGLGVEGIALQPGSRDSSLP
jgi:hypothetical protein